MDGIRTPVDTDCVRIILGEIITAEELVLMHESFHRTLREVCTRDLRQAPPCLTA